MIRLAFNCQSVSVEATQTFPVGHQLKDCSTEQITFDREVPNALYHKTIELRKLESNRTVDISAEKNSKCQILLEHCRFIYGTNIYNEFTE